MANSDKDAVRIPTPDDRPPSSAIIEAVAALTNTEPADCPTLHDYVNTDALNSLFDDRNGGRLSFQYPGCEVTVHYNNAVTVELSERSLNRR